MKRKTFGMAAALTAATVVLTPVLAEARPGGAVTISGRVGVGGPAFSGGHRGGWYGPRYGVRGGYAGHSGYRGHGGYAGRHGYRGYRGYYGSRGYWGPGPFWGGLGIGIGLGAIGYGAWNSYYPGPAYVVSPGYADYGVIDPVIGDDVVIQSDRTIIQTAPVSAAPDPIFYPKNGQSPTQIEADRRDCNRWATTQPSAMAVASVFQRATLACMEGRGYSVK